MSVVKQLPTCKYCELYAATSAQRQGDLCSQCNKLVTKGKLISQEKAAFKQTPKGEKVCLKRVYVLLADLSERERELLVSENYTRQREDVKVQD